VERGLRAGHFPVAVFALAALGVHVNRLIYIVGLVVVILAVLAFFGLR
jgi:hypothetical protein